MSTVTRPELSEKNKYYLEKHRYYELKHFCLQYPIWLRAYNALEGLSAKPEDLLIFQKSHSISNPTENCALSRLFYSERIDMIKSVCDMTDPILGKYILYGVTEERSYDNLRTVYDIPCCRESYYEMYRKFFWILNKVRN